MLMLFRRTNMPKHLTCLGLSLVLAAGLLFSPSASANEWDDLEAIALDGLEDAGELADAGEVVPEVNVAPEAELADLELLTDAELSDPYLNEDLLSIDNQLGEAGFESDDELLEDEETIDDEYINDFDDSFDDSSIEDEYGDEEISEEAEQTKETSKSSSSSSSSGSSSSRSSSNSGASYSEESNMQVSANTGEGVGPLTVSFIAGLSASAIVMYMRARKAAEYEE